VIGGKIKEIINDHQVLTMEFNEVMLMGYTQILFSIVESKFRLFQTAINPNAKEGDFFINVYTLLLKTLDKCQYQKLIEFFSLIRNTIHNNGIYVNANKPHIPIEYREKNV
jgi:hypothetical protein